MRLSKKDLTALRAAALSLASDICEGRGPAWNGWSWCGCAAGEVVKRAGLPDECGETAAGLDTWGNYLPPYMLTHATDKEQRGLFGATVFPLLWLADELGTASASSPSKAVLEES